MALTNWHEKIRKNRYSIIFLSIFIVINVIGLFSWWRGSTLVWEHTDLNDFLRPSSRSSCVIPPYVTTGDVNATSDARDLLTNTEDTTEKLRIGIISIYSKISDAWSSEVIERVRRNREFYCNKRGYDLLNGSLYFEPTRHPSWSKLIATEKFFSTGKYDYLFYVDMDMVIMNMDKRIEDIIAASTYKHDFIITKDFNGLNGGVWIAKNTDWTMYFLQLAWNQTQLVPSYDANGTPHPFRYEQRAFHFLLNTQAWKNSGCIRYTGDSMELRRHFFTIPQCAFNSYLLHPLAPVPGRDEAQYIPGDFMIHFAGKNSATKMMLVNNFLDRVENKYNYK